MTPREWLNRNSNKLGSKYERLFVEEVLSQVPNLYFEVLEAQMPFKDLEGKQRYCDFAIREGQEVRIAIEVDGWDKTGSGTGMTTTQYEDWLRRQNALIAQGWKILRFANREVLSNKHRCVKHISLLLRYERQKAGHQESLRRYLETLKKRPQETQLSPAELQALREKRVAVQNQLTLAKETKHLDAAETAQLDELTRAQEEIFVLKKEASIMKTTIWAFTALIGLIIVALIFKIQGSAPNPAPQQTNPAPQQTNPAPQQTNPAPPQRTPVPQLPPLGSSCENPRNWQEARNFISQTAAFSGPVIDVTSKPSVNGKPTWITVGAAFPEKNRLELLIWGENLHKFNPDLCRRKTACALGDVQTYKGTIQIELKQPSQLICK